MFYQSHIAGNTRALSSTVAHKHNGIIALDLLLFSLIPHIHVPTHTVMHQPNAHIHYMHTHTHMQTRHVNPDLSNPQHQLLEFFRDFPVVDLLNDEDLLGRACPFEVMLARRVFLIVKFLHFWAKFR